MRFSVLAISAMLAFGGCAEKGAFDLFKMDDAHERAVEQLRTGSIVLSLETKAIISTLYLNPIYPEHYNDGEYFIGAVYFEKDIRGIRERMPEDAGYQLTLNGKKPTFIEVLKEKDPRRRFIPIQNNWNRYYIIRFAEEQNSSLALRLENNQTGSVVLHYQKKR